MSQQTKISSPYNHAQGSPKSDTFLQKIQFWSQNRMNAYDIKTWHNAIRSTLVSKQPFGPQQSHPFMRFWLNDCLRNKNWTCFPLIFWKSFVFFANKSISLGGPSSMILEISFGVSFHTIKIDQKLCTFEIKNQIGIFERP
jgi:hypothetical protein